MSKGRWVSRRDMLHGITGSWGWGGGSTRARGGGSIGEVGGPVRSMLTSGGLGNRGYLRLWVSPGDGGKLLWV